MASDLLSLCRTIYLIDDRLHGLWLDIKRLEVAKGAAFALCRMPNDGHAMCGKGAALLALLSCKI